MQESVRKSAVFLCNMIVIYQPCALRCQDCTMPGESIWMVSHGKQMELHPLRSLCGNLATDKITTH